MGGKKVHSSKWHCGEGGSGVTFDPRPEGCIGNEKAFGGKEMACTRMQQQTRS